VSNLAEALPRRWLHWQAASDTVTILGRERRVVRFVQPIVLDRPVVLAGCHGLFDSAAAVVVPPGGALRLSRTTLAPAKSKNWWPGLWLHDGGTLTADTASRIVRAHTAVEAPTRRHALHIQGLTVDDCHTGICAKTAAPTQIHKR
jgi:hypothetical protein